MPNTHPARLAPSPSIMYRLTILIAPPLLQCITPTIFFSLSMACLSRRCPCSRPIPALCGSTQMQFAGIVDEVMAQMSRQSAVEVGPVLRPSGKTTLCVVRSRRNHWVGCSTRHLEISKGAKSLHRHCSNPDVSIFSPIAKSKAEIKETTERVDRLNKTLDEVDKELHLEEEDIRKLELGQARVRDGEDMFSVRYVLHCPLFGFGTVKRLSIFERVQGSVRTTNRPVLHCGSHFTATVWPHVEAYCSSCCRCPSAC